MRTPNSSSHSVARGPGGTASHPYPQHVLFGNDEPVRVALVHDAKVVLAGLRHLTGPLSDRVLILPELGAVAGADLVLHGGLRPPVFRRVTRNALEAIYAFRPVPAEVRDAVQRGASGAMCTDWSGDQFAVAAETAIAARRASPPGRVAGRVLIPTNPEVAATDVGLSPRESELMRLIAQGISNEEIAVVMGVTINSVKSYIRSAYRKIGVTRRTQAVLWALANANEPARGLRPIPVRPLPRNSGRQGLDPVP